MWVVTVAFVMTASGDTLRYLVYLAPLALWLFALVREASLGRQALTIDRDALRFLLAYSIIWFAAKLNSPLPVSVGGGDFVFITVPAFAILVPFRVTENTDRILVWSGIIAATVFSLLSLQSFVGGFDLLHSRGGIETGLAFTFTVAAITSAYFSRRLLFILSLLFCFLFFKRIAFVSLFVSLSFLGSMVVVGRFIGAEREEQLLPIGKIIFWAVALMCLSVALQLDNIVQFINFHVARLYTYSPEELFLGRFAINQYFDQLRSQFNLYTVLFGQGPGSANWVLTMVMQNALHNVHNDYLKLVFDYGWFGFGVYLYCYYKLFSRSLLGLALGINSMILYVTDNTLIYVTYQMFAMFAAVSLHRWPATRRVAQGSPALNLHRG